MKPASDGCGYWLAPSYQHQQSIRQSFIHFRLLTILSMCPCMHRHRSSVNFRGHQIFARKICIKNQQNSRILQNSCPKNYQNTRIFMIFARKIYKIPEFHVIFTRKMPEFYVIIARKIFFPNFRGARAPPCPRLLRLCLYGIPPYLLDYSGV